MAGRVASHFWHNSLLRGQLYAGLCAAVAAAAFCWAAGAYGFVLRNYPWLLGCLFAACAACVIAINAVGMACAHRAMRNLFAALGKELDPALPGGGVGMLTLPPSLRQFQEMLRLRMHAEGSAFRQRQADMHAHYHRILAHVLMLSRRHQDDAALLETVLGDYAHVMAAPTPVALQHAQSFDLFALVDRALASARKLQPPADKVHLAISLQPGTAKRWIGHPHLLETLLRQMLVMALKRTRAGFISLRLKTLTYEGCDNQSLLEILMEDSGPPLQPGQVQSWLHDDASAMLHESSAALPWCIMVNVAKALQCTLTAKNSESGLVLEGKAALEKMPADVLAFPGVNTEDKAVQRRMKLPLVLVVEDDAKERRHVAQLFTQAGCRTFIVDNHAQALSWAAVLPFSAVLFNLSLADTKNLPRRLHGLIEHERMRDVPFWAVAAREPFMQFDRWQHAGISELLFAPLTLDMLQPLCRRLSPREEEFYRLRDARTHDEMPVAAKRQMGELHAQLNQQLVPVEVIAAKFAQGDAGHVTMHEAHAVKSAALSLGYFRLAGCMGEIENAIVNRAMPPVADNWRVIAECLRTARF